MNDKAWDAISTDYAAHVVSPFDDGTENPLFDQLLAVENASGKTVADLGCGVGALVPFLSETFDRVVAIDFSRGMLRQARRATQAENVSFQRADLADLSPFRERFDVAVAVNSVLAPSPRTVNRILHAIHSSLKPGGEFLGIFPSMESILYHAMLVLERESAHCASEAAAIRRAARIAERRKYDFMLGIFRDSDGGEQKHYYRFELQHRLRNAGFAHCRFSRVLYPWDESASGFECFPGQPKMWDWLVRAERRQNRAAHATTSTLKQRSRRCFLPPA